MGMHGLPHGAFFQPALIPPHSLHANCQRPSPRRFHAEEAPSPSGAGADEELAFPNLEETLGWELEAAASAAYVPPSCDETLPARAACTAALHSCTSLVSLVS